MKTVPEGRTTASASSGEKKKRGLGLTSQIVIGLILEILVGLFFGQRASGMGIVDTVHLRLLAELRLAS